MDKRDGGVGLFLHFCLHVSVVNDAMSDDGAALDAVAVAVSTQNAGGDFRNLVDNFDFRDLKKGSIPDSG